MTDQFASIELARLYESQGYTEDALAMYKVLAEQDAEGEGEIRAAVARLESALSSGDEPRQSPQQHIAEALAELGESPPGEITEKRVGSEDRISSLLEKWLMLMVVRKRVKLFKAIRARL